MTLNTISKPLLVVVWARAQKSRCEHRTAQRYAEYLFRVRMPANNNAKTHQPRQSPELRATLASIVKMQFFHHYRCRLCVAAAQLLHTNARSEFRQNKTIPGEFIQIVCAHKGIVCSVARWSRCLTITSEYNSRRTSGRFPQIVWCECENGNGFRYHSAADKADVERKWLMND